MDTVNDASAEEGLSIEKPVQTLMPALIQSVKIQVEL